MPRATANTEETVRHELKTLPDGFVVIKRLSYGAKLHRRALVSKMTFSGGGKSSDMAGEMQLINEAATQYDFAHCIVEHNLEDETGRVLDFAKPVDVRSLDPRIGEEIDVAIGELNNFEESEDEGPN